MKAEEERCEEREGKQGSAKASAKEEVPDELRFGFRDEMGKDGSKGKEKEPLAASNVNDKNQIEDALEDRRESIHFAGPEDLKSLPPPVPASPPAAPTLRQPLPTRTSSAPSGSVNNGVPGWVDKAIVGVVAGLLVMVVKKIAI